MILFFCGFIELTEKDEFSFHEMMTHLPLFSHPDPKSVLIVGGGDGGVLREVCRHNCVEKVTLVDIDPMVLAVSRKFLSTSISFDDPRLTIVHQDAAEFLADGVEGTYDIIIADTSDPMGPAESLFQPDFYESMHSSLKEGGIVCAQCECMWIHLNMISDVFACCSDIFDTLSYASTMVPSYPCGQIGFLLAGKGQDIILRSPCRTPSFQSQLKWYNPSVHRASFVLPQFVEDRLAPYTQAYLDDEEESDTMECFLSRCKLPSFMRNIFATHDLTLQTVSGDRTE
jgi:spermidine synthase